jgi:glucose/arabinose dehydrogenase
VRGRRGVGGLPPVAASALAPLGLVLAGLVVAGLAAAGQQAAGPAAPSGQEREAPAGAGGAERDGTRRLPLEAITLPPGFEISVFAADVPDARSLAHGQGPVVFVGTRRAGVVYAIPYREGRATRVVTLASGLTMPNGVAARDGDLYVAEVGRILRFPGVEARLDQPGEPIVVTDRFPGDVHHGWKFIRFGPDAWLYVPVGAPCNVCEPHPERHALIARIRHDGTSYEVVARGVRNTLGFDWHPQTRDLWFTDNGPDGMGDDVPSDELNHLSRPGLHFGFPYCHAGDVPDPHFGGRRPCAEFVPPAARLGAHVAPLGMRFYTGAQFPTEYLHNIFVAEHGSWDRSVPVGHRLTRVEVVGGHVTRREVFAKGWLAGDRVLGRPVDVEVMPDGSLLVSDDHAGAIYRITYHAPPR